MSTTPERPKWQLVFTLPNLRLRERDLNSFGLTLGLPGIAITSVTDARVESIRRWSRAADQFLGSFHDGNGTPVECGVLLVREDWQRRFRGSPEPVIAFRNAVALSSVLANRARRSGSSSWIGPSWSDTFDFHHAQLRLDGSDFDVLNPALNSWGFRLANLSLTPDIGVPAVSFGSIDSALASRLGHGWKRRYLQRRDLINTARIFRSLELSYQASAMGFKNYGSLSEVGINTVHWANAVEILASPTDRNVKKMDGVQLVGEFDWTFEPRLKRRQYRIQSQRRSKTKPRKFESLNLAQKVYIDLHNARSKFVHGDKVSHRLLSPYGDDAPSLLSLASTIYRLALMAYFNRHWAWQPDFRGSITLDFLTYGAYEQHLLAAIGEEEWE